MHPRAASSALLPLVDLEGPKRGTPLEMADTRPETQKAKLTYKQHEGGREGGREGHDTPRLRPKWPRGVIIDILF